MMASDCTIVMAVRNRENIVRHTLGSIAAQSYRPLRVVLVDNGSADATMDVLQEWKKSHQAHDFNIEILEEPRPGATVARNRGLAQVETEYVMFFDSDDLMAPEHVANAMQYLSQHPDTDILGWNVVYHYGDKPTMKPFEVRNPLYHCIMHGSFATQRYLCRTQMVRDAGAWDEAVPYWNDIELGTRILMRYPQAKIARVKRKPTVHVIFSPDSITGRRFSDRRDEALTAASRIQRTIGAKNKKIVDLKLAILAGDIYLEGEKPMATDLMRIIMAGVDNGWHRILLHAVYRYRRAGGRGAARIVHYLL